jgi:ribosomal protein S18 acetylase RimI-like enzyme
MIRVAQLEPEDWERLRSIRLRALRDAPDAFGTTLDAAVAQSPESWSKQILAMSTFIATSDGVDVGVVRCAPDTTSTETAWLISMWVAPEARRRGIGAALADAVTEHARSRGMARLLLDVRDDNEPAIALYAGKGFKRTGVVSTFPPPRQYLHEHQRELLLAPVPSEDD